MRVERDVKPNKTTVKNNYDNELILIAAKLLLLKIKSNAKKETQ